MDGTTSHGYLQVRDATVGGYGESYLQRDKDTSKDVRVVHEGAINE